MITNSARPRKAACCGVTLNRNAQANLDQTTRKYQDRSAFLLLRMNNGRAANWRMTEKATSPEMDLL